MKDLIKKQSLTPAKIVGKSKRVHFIKCWPVPFNDIQMKLKTFEYRKRDRDYKVGDYLCLFNYNPKMEEYKREFCLVQVIHILDNFPSLPKDYIIMSIRKRQNSQISFRAIDELEKRIK